MPRRQVLLFTDWFYPGFMAGGTIQSAFNLVNGLGGRHDFSVVTRDTDYTSAAPYEGIKSDAWNILANGMRVFYFSSAKLTYANLSGLIKRERFDVAYINGMYSPRLSIFPLIILSRLGKKTILAPRGMLAPSAIAIKSWKKRPFLFWIRNSGLLKDTRFHAASDLEADHIRAVFGQDADIRVAPNLPGRAGLPPFAEKRKEPGSVDLISIARISPEKNLLFALEILRRVKGRIRFDIHGPVYDRSYWKRCEELMGRMPNHVRCRYHGPIEKEKIPARLADAHFFFLPTRGESFGHAILEALASGCPPIISDQTPWRGLTEGKAGSDIPLGRPDGFVRFLEEAVAMDAGQLKYWSQAARLRAGRFIDDPDVLQRSVQLFG